MRNSGSTLYVYNDEPPLSQPGGINGNSDFNSTNDTQSKEKAPEMVFPSKPREREIGKVDIDNRYKMKFGDFVILDFKKKAFCPVTVLKISATFSQMSLVYNYVPEGDCYKCVISIDDEIAGDAIAYNQDAAKRVAESRVLFRLKQICWTIEITTYCKKASQNAEYNRFMKMIQNGWDLENSKIQNSVIKREGFISDQIAMTSKELVKKFEIGVKDFLENFAVSDYEESLLFSSEFSPRQRKIICSLCKPLKLFSNIRRRGKKNFLLVSRKRLVCQLVDHLLSLNEQSSKYGVVPPPCLMPTPQTVTKSLRPPQSSVNSQPLIGTESSDKVEHEHGAVEHECTECQSSKEIIDSLEFHCATLERRLESLEDQNKKLMATQKEKKTKKNINAGDSEDSDSEKQPLKKKLKTKKKKKNVDDSDSENPPSKKKLKTKKKKKVDDSDSENPPSKKIMKKKKKKAVDESEDSDDEKTPSKKKTETKKKKKKNVDESEDSDDEKPPSKKKTETKKKKKNVDESEDSDDEKPPSKKKTKTKKKKNVDESEDSDEEKPSSKKKTKTKKNKKNVHDSEDSDDEKPPSKKKIKKKKKKADDESEDSDDEEPPSKKKTKKKKKIVDESEDSADEKPPSKKKTKTKKKKNVDESEDSDDVKTPSKKKTKTKKKKKVDESEDSDDVKTSSKKNTKTKKKKNVDESEDSDDEKSPSKKNTGKKMTKNVDETESSDSDISPPKKKIKMEEIRYDSLLCLQSVSSTQGGYHPGHEDYKDKQGSFTKINDVKKEEIEYDSPPWQHSTSMTDGQTQFNPGPCMDGHLPKIINIKKEKKKKKDRELEDSDFDQSYSKLQIMPVTFTPASTSLDDLSDLRDEFESETEWQYRHKFLQDNKNSLPLDRLVCLSRCFVNMAIYQCSYPPTVMQEVRERSNGVLDQIRKARQTAE